MAKDFRDHLVEAMRHEEFGRTFKEIRFGMKLVLSFQASALHACEPAETLDDPHAYTQWEVTVRQINKPVDTPGIGAWDSFKEKEWAKPFDRPEFQRDMIGEFIPTEHCQQLYEDVLAYALEKGHMESEDDITILEADENLKMKHIKACRGCAGAKAGKPAPAPAK
ncbi:hypothetical protein [Pseudodesulfovibrio tunisiensis]|uniref:hypothetical protein n=1 Tax=Pseudodesulfovibrio tunisiensis TaxID=463192 RepID=UPI001FB4C7EF|nr:hypothetical protein [Pseudodesulfovibrio tunisiensis]